MLQKSRETLVNCGIKLPTLQRKGNTYPFQTGKSTYLWDGICIRSKRRVSIINWCTPDFEKTINSIVSVKILGLLKKPMGGFVSNV